MNSGNISFSEKKASRNAIITLVLGISILAGFFVLTLYSVLSGGKLPVIGGLLGCIFVLLAFFGVFWGILSYDDVKTTQKYKISGICINIVAIFIGITFIMM